MKIVITTNEDYIFKPELIKKINERLPGELFIDSVFITKFESDKVKLTTHIKHYLNILGYRELLLHGYESIKYNFINHISRFLPLKHTFSVRSACQELGLKHYAVDNLNDSNILSIIQEISPDIILNMGNQIFGSKLLAVPKYGCINKHCSLLPSYQGIYPVWWCLLKGEEFCGITLHKMGKKLDEGEILAQKKIKIEQTDSLYSLYAKCYDLLPDLIISTLISLEQGNETTVKNQYHSSYFGFPDKNDRRLFFKQNKKIQ